MIKLEGLTDEAILKAEGDALTELWSDLKNIESQIKRAMSIAKPKVIEFIQANGEEVTATTKRLYGIDCQTRSYVKIKEVSLKYILEQKNLSMEDVSDIQYKISEEKLETLLAEGTLTEEDIDKCTEITKTLVLKMKKK